MKHLVITCVAFLAGCTQAIEVQVAPPDIPADLLQEEPGYEGPLPLKFERDLARALLAEKEGRLRANSKLKGIAEIVKTTDAEDSP